MKRRTLLSATAAALATPLARPHAQKPVTIRWWYHFDDPKATPAELIAAFEKEHPDIHIEAENIPWGGGGDYDNRMYTSIIAGNGPDTAMVKFNNLARLMEMDALTPLDKWIDAWPARTDISADLWRLHTAPDGKRYYMPLQYVVLYLYVRLDLLAKKNLQPPTNFDEFLTAAKALTGGEQWGFGLRGGSGGHDSWMPFAFGTGAKPVKGGFVSAPALAQNRYFIDLYRTHKVVPPSAPTDSFLQIVNNMKAGRTAMTVHHISTANDMVATFGDAITAVVVPRGPNGTGWATFGDGSNAVFSASKNPEAAWTWISWLSTGSNNVLYNKFAGQMTVTTSGAKNWTLHPKRFVDATVGSLPIAGVLPNLPQTADFTRVVWPQNTQKALLGQVGPDEMMQTFEKLFYG
ncbi:MAG TPA: sugar ABC transporter substrate-binding protein [Acetobacteraceae bacterium]|nr:sugar ABC transporter substrate-binding protein [Acetobacteraceae bacterium]